MQNAKCKMQTMNAHASETTAAREVSVCILTFAFCITRFSTATNTARPAAYGRERAWD
jgi:hypothetical protein